MKFMDDATVRGLPFFVQLCYGVMAQTSLVPFPSVLRDR